MCASLMPKEMKAAITNVHFDRLTDAELDAIIAEEIQRGFDPAATDEDA
jgi:hypothetical protein